MSLKPAIMQKSILYHSWILQTGVSTFFHFLTLSLCPWTSEASEGASEVHALSNIFRSHYVLAQYNK
jgi:hypothetical protein